MTTALAPSATPALHGQPETRRSATPAWVSVAAWGAALIELALGAGAIIAGDAGWGAGIALIALGTAGLAWGAATLARGRIVVPRVGVAVALLGVGGVTTALVQSPAATGILPVAAAIVLLVAVAMACVRQHRTQAEAAPPRMAALFGAAVLVAAIVTPALGATEAGRLAPDHSSHGFSDLSHHGR